MKIHQAAWFLPVLALITVLGTCMRISQPFGERLICSDSPSYLAIANNIAQGVGFTEHEQDHHTVYMRRQTAWRAPGYPAFMALFFRLHPTQPELVVKQIKNAQAVLGGLTVFLLGLFGWLIHKNSWAGWLAAAMLAQQGLSIDLSKMIITENLFLFLLLLTLVLLQAILARPKLWLHVLAGLFLGLSLLTRPLLYLFLAMAGGWMIWRAWRQRPAHKHLRNSLVFIIVTIAVTLPWIARNTMVNHQLTFLTTNNGFNLYVANSGRSHSDVWTEFFKLAGGEMRDWTEAQRNSYYLHRALKNIAGHPVRFSSKVLSRCWQMALDSPVLNICALLGLLLLLRQRRKDNVFALLIIVNFIATYAITSYNERMSVTLDPFKFLYAAYLLCWLSAAARSRLFRRHDP